MICVTLILITYEGMLHMNQEKLEKKMSKKAKEEFENVLKMKIGPAPAEIETITLSGNPSPIVTIKDTQFKPLNVWQKLVAVRKTIGYIKKGAQGYGYKYAKESDVLLAMAEEMNNQGLILEQVPLSCDNVPVNFKGKEVAGLRIHFQYIITDSDNPSDQIVRSQFMQQPGCDAQTIGSMMTYGMKYFLFKTFNIAMDEYDVDAMDKSKEEHAPIQQKTAQNQTQMVQSNTSEKITPQQVQVIKNMLDISKSEGAFLQWIFREYNYTAMEDIKKIHLDHIIRGLQMKINEVSGNVN